MLVNLYGMTTGTFKCLSCFLRDSSVGSNADTEGTSSYRGALLNSGKRIACSYLTIICNRVF